jgi:hypothetical protein
MSVLGTCPVCRRNERMDEGAASCIRCQSEHRTEGDLLAEADAELEAIGTTPSSWEPIDLGPVLDGSESGTPPTILERTDGQCLLYPAERLSARAARAPYAPNGRSASGPNG